MICLFLCFSPSFPVLPLIQSVCAFPFCSFINIPHFSASTLAAVLQKSKDKSVSGFPVKGNLLAWNGTIHGPPATVYEGLTYKLSLSFPSDYPCTAPTVKFVTPCYHPNVDQHGNICLDILKEQWSAVYDVGAVLRSIQSLLGEPNNDSPLNAQAAGLWEDQKTYKKTLHAHYEQNAKK